MSAEEDGDEEEPMLVHPIDGLKRWMEVAPDRFSYAFVSCSSSSSSSSSSSLDEERKLTARDMHSRHLRLAKMFAGALTAAKRVIFLYEPGIDWFPVFLALLRMAIVPCVVYPIDPMTTPRDVLKERYEFLKVLGKECAGVVCSSKMATALRLTRLKLLDAQGLNCKILVVDEFKTTFDSENGVSDDEKVWKHELESPAFIQYTSGSTGSPKGVILSHRALMENCLSIRKAFKTTPYDSLCSWLPQYHDMGLIGGFFVPLTIASGYDDIDVSLLPKRTTCAFISPIAFAKDPSVWIRLISKYESTMTQAPDFAFALAARKFNASNLRNTETLRLHSLRHVLNASEPVRSQTINDFFDTFQHYGLKRSSLRVGYGLAEVCVYATEHRVEFFCANREAIETGDVRVAKEAKNGESFIEVACVGMNTNKRFKILEFDSDVEVKTHGQVGRVVITNTRSLCSGYVKDESRTHETFNFHRNEVVTGDEGFVLQDGRVFILGRIVDILDISFFASTVREDASSRIQANEFERVALAGPLCSVQNLVRKGSASAFGVGKHESAKIVLVVEVSDAFFSQSKKSVNSKALRGEIECNVFERYGKVSRRRFEVLLTYPRSTPRTTSGKVRRFAVRRKYDEGGIEAIVEDDDDEEFERDELDEIDEFVLEVVKENVEGAGAHTTLRTPLLGATSVQFTKIGIEITKRFDITLDTYHLLSCTNARDIASLVKRALGNDYDEYNIISSNVETPAKNQFPSARFATLFVILFAAQHQSISMIVDQKPRTQHHQIYDNRAAEWLHVLVPFQVISLLLYHLIVAITRARRYESINLIGAFFGLLSCVVMHGVSKAAWLISCCMIAYRAKKNAPRLFRKPTFIWTIACLSFATIAKLERKHASGPLLAASGHIDTTGSPILDGVYGNTSFHIFRASRYVVLRVIDYYLSSAGDQKSTIIDVDDNMLTFLHYVFFAPLFQCGPLIRGGFDTFCKRLRRMSSTRLYNTVNKNRKNKRRVAWQFAKDVLDLFGWCLLSNFLATSQTILTAPSASSLRLLSRILHVFATSRIAFNLGRVIAHAMRFTDVSDDAPLFLYDCLASFRQLWWHFHVSFRDFFARNIYSKSENKTIAIALTFFISACFHDVSLSDRRWFYFFLANTFGVLVERALLGETTNNRRARAQQQQQQQQLLRLLLLQILKSAFNRAIIWTLLVFSDGTVPVNTANSLRYLIKTMALSLVL